MFAYLIVFGVVTPFGLRWLAARQMLPPNRNIWELTLGIWLFVLFMALPFLFALWAARLKKSREGEDAFIPPPYPTVTVLRSRPFATRVYRLYLAPERLCFARVGGQFYSEDSPAARGNAGIFLMPFIERALRQKRRREALYDSIDSASPDFLTVDPENFQFPRDKIASIDYIPLYKCPFRLRFSFGSCAGVLTLTLHDAPPLKFGLIDDLSAPEVETLLSSWRSAGPPHPPP